MSSSASWGREFLRSLFSAPSLLNGHQLFRQLWQRPSSAELKAGARNLTEPCNWRTPKSVGWPQTGRIEVRLATTENCRQLGTVEGADLQPTDVGSNTSFAINGYGPNHLISSSLGFLSWKMGIMTHTLTVAVKIKLNGMPL